MHEKRFDGDIDRLRAPERVARLEVQRVISLCLENTNIESVLDIGTGSGLFAQAFALQGLKVSGVDANPAMIPAALQYVPEENFREAVAEALPFSDASFDLAFLGLILHESDAQLQALKEAHRVARHRVCVLEWPYQEAEFGPPLAHRLKTEEVAGLAKEVGFKQWETLPLSNLVLYRLTK